MPGPNPSREGAANEPSEGLDSLIRAARDVQLIDPANRGWTLVVSEPTKDASGTTLEIEVDSTNPSAILRLLQRVERLRTPVDLPADGVKVQGWT